VGKDKDKDKVREKDRDKKTRTAIYDPPKSGMPYLVVTVAPEGISATAVETKEAARVLAGKKTLEVRVRDATNGAPPGA
jgi:hypothetical protein